MDKLLPIDFTVQTGQVPMLIQRICSMDLHRITEIDNASLAPVNVVPK